MDGPGSRLGGWYLRTRDGIVCVVHRPVAGGIRILQTSDELSTVAVLAKHRVAEHLHPYLWCSAFFLAGVRHWSLEADGRQRDGYLQVFGCLQGRRRCQRKYKAWKIASPKIKYATSTSTPLTSLDRNENVRETSSGGLGRHRPHRSSPS